MLSLEDSNLVNHLSNDLIKHDSNSTVCELAVNTDRTPRFSFVTPHSAARVEVSQCNRGEVSSPALHLLQTSHES